MWFDMQRTIVAMFLFFGLKPVLVMEILGLGNNSAEVRLLITNRACLSHV